VFRSTISPFTPSGVNQIASGVTGTSFSNSGLTASTTFFYLVEAVNSGGTSSPSNQASATTQAGTVGGPLQINSGGPAVSPFVADVDFTGGATINHANAINLSGVTNPAPMAVYQSARIGNFTYTLPGFAAGSTHTVRLHFAETFFAAAGSRTFNVSINGTQVLTNFDIFATAGAMNKALVEQFTVNANASGQYVIVFTTVINNSLVSGIEVQ
jgi:chitodextrinase